MREVELTVGELSKEELVHSLKEMNILINPLGKQLLESELFEVTKERKKVVLTELSLLELGLVADEANLLGIIKRAEQVGLEVCSPDVAPFLRMVYFDDKGSHGFKKEYKTPDGAVTILSKILSEDVAFPKGFYLRKVDEDYWLRGYVCDYEHQFSLDETFIFMNRVKK